MQRSKTKQRTLSVANRLTLLLKRKLQNQIRLFIENTGTI
jgi:hypothetical protein